LIINVGHDVVEKPPFFMTPTGFKVIHINFRSSAIDSVYFPQLDCLGEIVNNVRRITARITRKQSWDFDYYQRIKEQVERHIAECADDDSFPVKPQRLVKLVRSVMPSDGIVALDNGIYKIWFARNYKAHGPNTVLLDNALASMGAGLPSAMAAALMHPERKVLAVVGDGGFMMNSQELETAARMGLNLTVLILNDYAYGMIKWKQQDMDFPNFGLEFNNPDFVKYAESYGVSGHSVASTEALKPQLEACLNEPGVHLIDCPVDYSENNRVLNEELKSMTCVL
jgi:acetolactate synthase-1/2/3 large subunit